jgi:nitrate reductase NapE component
MRLSYLPPLMVYAAYGIQGLTGIVGTFFVKDYLDLSAEFLAALAFWAGIPWAVKMPVGHVVDLIWRWKAILVWLGAAMIAASLLIMIGLISHLDALRAMMSPERWFVLAALVAPTGYMIQDAVADAMTVEAVPRVDENGKPYDAQTRKAMHTTMQTLGRMAIIGGLALVALANVFLFHGTEAMPRERKAEMYAFVYTVALIIPVLSVLGVVLHGFIKMRQAAHLRRLGRSKDEIDKLLAVHGEEVTRPNWWILGGSLVFVLVTLSVGVSELRFGQEVIFLASMAIIVFLLWRLARELEPAARDVLVATALIVFVFRAMPGPGPGSTWWMIDILKFDEAFLSKLSLVAYALTLVGMVALRGYMARTSMAKILVMLTIVGTILGLPNIGMYYGLHEWTAAHTGGLVDARFIALIDTALESPLGQIAMIPMLAWIASSAPANLKATYFAVMASFSNLALSAAQLGTKYLNQWFTVTREVQDRASGAIKVPQDYTQLGALMITATVLAFVLPLVAVAVVRALRLRTA